MKHKIISIMLIGCMLVGTILSLNGCGIKNDTTKAANSPTYYTSEDDLPEDAYYIVRTIKTTTKTITGKKETKKEKRYYPLLQAENTLTDTPEEVKGYDPTRVTWVNSTIDEAQIPTMYAGDKMIYKSSKSIPEKYSMEKFFDNGYTLGVMGLTRDLSGNYRYYGKSDSSSQVSHTMSTSDATGFDALENVKSIYLVQVGDKKVTAANVSQSGTITGLKKNKSYKCDIRQGTKKIDASLTANIHYFSSAETYMFGSFTFITPVVAKINIPDYVTTGYYNLGSGGFFRYITEKNIKNYTKLKASDYNDTIYTYNEEGTVDSTTLGYVFDDNGFLVPVTEENQDTNADHSKLTYKDYVNGKNKSKKKSSITNKTQIEKENEDNYSGTYVVESISDPKIVGSKTVYTLTATNPDAVETLDFKYKKSKEGQDLVVGTEYIFTFKESNDFDGYEITSVANPNPVNEMENSN